ncbi:MAG: heavy metal translocating P-type ATPase metal-binding domain-containing protein [Flavobacteriales bacterium]|jgi:Cu+-exporting ATPase|uniref:heavy metal translocating P-type ATPase n=1 Tax=Candidatus Ulvibacter alkanivorans TaxID=2267620 RepID=UPI000DF1620B|nr:heavy metal translocating P-type ATPase metal-binding domain-containing protein [Candidatus Ulvibacter alkanivorans]MCH2489373.1 heavy metal translocating P-type ATPase metal-binding domain-containing protein [Flavobacteriales bacterium]
MSTCFHCGDPCTAIVVEHQQKSFCCYGCKTVFDILNDNDLSYYYEMERTPGISPVSNEGKFDFLENEQIVASLIEFDAQGVQVVSLLIPTIHCSSCIWVLENINKLNPAVKSAQVNFPKKTVRITYANQEICLRELVELLARIGYEPYISLDDANKQTAETDRSLLYKLGVAGFAFGNIMFLSFPEYFEVNEFWLDRFKHLFRWLMFAFAVPVVCYSAQDYFISAYKGIRSKMLNIDVPIAIGVAVLFLRSAVEIIMDLGTGFLDSLAGLVFFLLLGKFFQQKTYAFLSFERDYKSYFPIAVTRIVRNEFGDNKEEQTQVQEINKGDHILIRNGELLPVDGILVSGSALIDYSFVTGEAEPIVKQSGEKLYAGGRQQAGLIEVEVLKPVAQSYLTQLWSNEVFSKNKQTSFENLTDGISKRFTVSLLLIALVATVYWLFVDASMALTVFTAVLIVACPCAIALAAPFTLGNLLRIFGKHKLYIKDSSVIEQMAHIDTVVFDKTGTLTTNTKNVITYEGIALTNAEKLLLTSTLRASNHPLSRSLYALLDKNNIETLDDFSEAVGYGMTGTLKNRQIKIGSLDFVTSEAKSIVSSEKTAVHISTDKGYRGCYLFYTEYRSGVEAVFNNLRSTAEIVILSGDNDGERAHLTNIAPSGTKLYFNQSPSDKLRYIEQLQASGKKVLMVGDGLNDAGALAQSNVGISVSENVNVFSPACDGILDASRFRSIPTFLSLARKGTKTIKYAFLFSLFYNLIGLGFAVTGNLAPVVAAILMPLSSISIVVFTTVITHIIGKKLTLNQT